MLLKYQQMIGLFLLHLLTPAPLDTPGHCDNSMGSSRGGVGP